MSRVSVVIPTYNRRDFLVQAINSVLRQTKPCDELLIVDDGSTDNTRQEVARIIRTSPLNIRYIQQQNSGPAAARNRGVREAKYDLIAFLDSDDRWEKRKLAYQLQAMENDPDYLISHTLERWYRRGEHLNQKKKHIPRHGNIFTHCLQLCAVGMSTVMVRRELFEQIGPFNEELRCCEDYDLWLRASARYAFLLVEKKLTVKEGGREDQVSFQYRLGMDKLRIDAIVNLVQAGGLTPEQENNTLLELRKKCTIYGRGCLKHGKRAEGEHYLQLIEELNCPHQV